MISALILALVGYVGWHLWRITPQGWKWVSVGVFVLWMASLFIGYAIIDRIPMGAASVLYEVGNTWLIAFLYLLLIFIVADVATLCHILPKTFLKDSFAGLGTVVGIVALILTLGGIHYHHKYREEQTVATTKPLEKPLTIVLASDLHIGYHNRKPELARWVDLINAENPDLVLFGGDVIDLSLRPVFEGNYAEIFHRVEAPMMAVLGNHEFYRDLDRAEQFFKDAGILLLKDSVAHFKGVDVIGRTDRTSPKRAALADLANGVERFTLVLDHQPFHLEEAEQAGIDFQFSGHTHRGQVWPLSWITDAMYEKAWGHHRRGSTQYYVSSGLGIWGAKIRVGTRSEYLVLHLTQGTSVPASCNPSIVDSVAVRSAVAAQMESYPESRLQDLYKSFFQDRFGPGHIIKDRQSALDYILSELAAADTLMGPAMEPCGWQGNYVRVNLSVVADGQMTADELTDALMASAKEVNEEDIKQWKTEWAEILAIIEREYPDIPDLKEDKARIDEMLASGQYAYHHSAEYNAAYHPHYRIIASELVDFISGEK